MSHETARNTVPDQTISPTIEYQTLREEQLQRLSRVYQVLLASIPIALGFIGWGLLHWSDGLVLMATCLCASIFIGASVYSCIVQYRMFYELGSYIITYHEGIEGGWIRLSRETGQALTEEEPRTTSSKWHADPFCHAIVFSSAELTVLLILILAGLECQNGGTFSARIALMMSLNVATALAVGVRIWTGLGRSMGKYARRSLEKWERCRKEQEERLKQEIDTSA